MTKESEYSEEDRLEVRAGKHKYLFVYPFEKKREWYRLPAEERMRIMREHIEIGRRYPQISINTTYSFGLDDQEFVVVVRVRRARRLPRPRARAAAERVERLHSARHADLHLYREQRPACTRRARRRGAGAATSTEGNGLARARALDPR